MITALPGNNFYLFELTCLSPITVVEDFLLENEINSFIQVKSMLSVSYVQWHSTNSSTGQLVVPSAALVLG
jgi:hypothetical protein